MNAKSPSSQGGCLIPVIRMLALCALLAEATTVCAQAWVQPRGALYLKLSGNRLSSEEEWSTVGDEQEIFADDPRITDASFRDVSLYAYAEYGVLDRFTLVWSVPFKALTSEFTQDPGGGLPSRAVTLNNRGLGDLWTLLRTALVEAPVALAVQGGVKVPVYTDPEDKGFLTVPPLGTGSVDAELGVYIGKSLHPVPAYVSGGVAYRARGGELSDEVPFNVEAGYTGGAVFVKIRLDGVRNTGDPGGGVIAGDEDFLKLSPELSYTLSDRVALAFEAFHTLSGKSTLAGTAFSIGAVIVRR